jgi:uncharacterized protein YbjT (DUF2867 family)
MRLFLRAALGLAVLAACATAAETQAKETVMVFGGSGQLGSEIVRAVAARGDAVTVFVRPSSDLKRVEGVQVKTLTGDVLNAEDVMAAMKAARPTVVVDALARGKADASFYDVSERNISTAAKAAGVKQIILHSSVGAGSSRKIYPKSRLAAMTPVLDAKTAGEDHVIASGVAYTIIRNGILRDPQPGTADGAKLYEDDTKYGVVTRPQLARLTAECIGNKSCFGKVYHAVDEGLPIPAGMEMR